MKKIYSAPALTVYGDATALTQGNKDGNFTDKAYPQHTPKGFVPTFSN